MKRYFFYILTCFFVFLLSCKESKKEKSFIKLRGKVFGTTYNIMYDAKEDYQVSIDSIFTKVNTSLSTYLSTSDISRINKNDTTVVVDELFAEVFAKAKQIYKATDGYFDPTLGQLINLYGFGSKKQKEEVTPERIKELMNLVGFDKIQLVNGKIKKQFPSIQFDVNAIAKGFGIDLVCRFLELKGITNYLVEIGGEIRTKGMKNGKPFKVAVEKPNTDGSQSFFKTIELTNKSMATSGNYRKFKINKEGKKYVHIINPKTGLATESNLLSASVIAPLDCADVDAYATAFMAMGLEKTKLFLKNNPTIKVILLYTDKNADIAVFSN